MGFIEPTNTMDQQTQTAIAMQDTKLFDEKLSYLDDVLDFYNKYSTSAFEDAVFVATSGILDYCGRCSHCARVK